MDLPAATSPENAASNARQEEARIAAEVGDARARRTLPLLDRVSVASPCPARWEGMKGTDQARFCGECKKNVYNLSAMTRDQAEAFLSQAESPCVRFYQRTDGTIITSDCPVGIGRKRRRTWLASMAATAVAALAGLGFLGSRRARQGEIAMGAMGIPEPSQQVTAGLAVVAPDVPPEAPTAKPSASPRPHARKH